MFVSVDIRQKIRRKPFFPLRIVTTSGDTYDVFHPDLIILDGVSLLVGIPSHDNPSDYLDTTRIDFDDITALQDIHITPDEGGQQ